MILFQFLVRYLGHLSEKLPWWLLPLAIGVHFASSWWLMHLFEPDAKFVSGGVYWWFYLVTATTVGYGDFSPTTLGGRAVGAYVMILGIVIMGAVLGKITALVVGLAERRRMGMSKLHLAGHMIVVGDSTERTINLLKNLSGDVTAGDIVLVSERQENPLNGVVAGFVSGSIDDEVVQTNACLAEAKTVIVLADNDNEVVGRALAVLEVIQEAASVVVFFQNPKSAKRFDGQTAERVKCVTSVDMSAVAQEAQDPGAASFVHRLLDNHIDETYFRLTLPEKVKATYLDIATHLMMLRINPFGRYVDGEVEMCPDPSLIMTGGDVIAVAAMNRSVLDTIDWSGHIAP